MKPRILSLLAILALVCVAPARANLDAISNPDAVAGLKAALERGSAAAVGLLGRKDGYFGNNAVRIPLPDAMRNVERMMRNFAMGRYADQLILTMNRAAEAAAPEAKKLFTDAIKKMSVQDAKGVLTGGQTSGTEYFKRTTTDQLRERFLPIVRKATAKLKLAQKYSQFAEKGARFGVVDTDQANIDNYVTQKALEGLFYMVAEQEKRIRQDPARAGSGIIRKVFGAL